MKVQTFLCVGGPLDGNLVTEQYAGPNYHRFNSASGDHYPVVLIKGKRRYVSKRMYQKLNIGPYVHKCVLIYGPEPEPIAINDTQLQIK